MNYYGYILHSLITDEYYVGQTECIKDRLERHNAGRELSTRHGRPWEIVYLERLETRSLAMKWERKTKGRKSRAYLESLIFSSSNMSRM